MKKLLIALIVSLSLMATTCLAQDGDSNKNINIWKCACKYQNRSTETGNTLLTEEFYVIFCINKNKKRAFVKTIFEDSNDAIVIPNIMGGMSILQILDNGNVAVTTLDLQGRSVHSRNIIIKGISASSQYYGNCICISEE
jgi:hypothetical protein